MAVSNFRALFEGVCEIVGSPAAELSPDPEGITAFTVTVAGESINVLQYAEAPLAYLLVEIGAPAPADDSSLWRRFMDTNFLLAGEMPIVFSRNPASGRLTLQCTQRLAEASPVDLYQTARAMSDLARHWRSELQATDASSRPESARLDALA